MPTMNRIIVIGSGGAGKTTLALKMGQALGIPVIHLDKLYWKGHWEHLSKEEFGQALDRALAGETWIMDGNFSSTLSKRLAACDFALYLDFSPMRCVLGVLRRVLRYWGQTRPDMGGDCPEKLDFEFLKWVYTFRRKHRAEYMALLEASGKQYQVLKNRKDCSLFLSRIQSR